MAKYQIVGDQKPLKQNPPVGSPSADPKGGTYQMVGDQKRMSNTPVHSPSSNPSGGQYQIVGDQTNLSRNAVKGWGSAANLTMSHTAMEQSSNAAQKGGRKKK